MPRSFYTLKNDFYTDQYGKHLEQASTTDRAILLKVGAVREPPVRPKEMPVIFALKVYLPGEAGAANQFSGSLP